MAILVLRRYLLGVPHRRPLRTSTRPLLAVALGASLFGCEACGSTSTLEQVSETTPTPTPVPTTQSPPPVAEPSPPPPVEPERPAEPAPPLAITTRVSGGDVEVSIVNESDATVSFASTLVLESRDGESWREVTSRGRFVARLDAERALPECAELVRGASLELTFASLAGDPAPDPASVPAGEHRFVVTSCNGTGRTEGPAFTPSR